MKDALAILAFAVLVGSAQAQTAKFTFQVPADAKIYVDGSLAAGTGETRVFQTPRLEERRRYHYDVTVQVRRNQQNYDISERIDFVPGEHVERSFYQVLDKAEGRSYPRKHQFPLELRIHDLRMKEDLKNFLTNERNNNDVATMTPQQIAALENRDAILAAVADAEAMDINGDSISSVTYERVSSDTLKVVVEVLRSSKVYPHFAGRLQIRDSNRLYCVYRKVNGDWALEKYWSANGDTIGDYLLRWENSIGRFIGSNVVRLETNPAFIRRPA